MAIITRRVTIEIKEREILQFLADALSDRVKATEGKRLTFRRALSRLVGITDKEAVRMANESVEEENRITVTEFRRWLPEVISQFAADVLLEETNDPA